MCCVHVTLLLPNSCSRKWCPRNAIWTQWNKKGRKHLAPTVHTTVTQFHSVANVKMFPLDENLNNNKKKNPNFVVSLSRSDIFLVFTVEKFRIL